MKKEEIFGPTKQKTLRLNLTLSEVIEGPKPPPPGRQLMNVNSELRCVAEYKAAAKVLRALATMLYADGDAAK